MCVGSAPADYFPPHFFNTTVTRDANLGNMHPRLFGERLGDEFPQKLKQFADMFTDFDCRNHQNIANFAQFTSRFLTNMFHLGG